MGIFFTSDLHLGHAKVAAARGFGSVEEHDRAVLRGIQQVPDGAELWILGDVAMGNWRETLGALAGALYHVDDDGWFGQRCRVDAHLVLGNHDRAHPGLSRGFAYQMEMLSYSGAQTCQTAAEVRGFMLSHFPYDGDHVENDRFKQWRLRDLGTPLLHGHTHSSECVSRSRSGTLQIHVGLDSWGLEPVSLGTIQELVREYQQ